MDYAKPLFFSRGQSVCPLSLLVQLGYASNFFHGLCISGPSILNARTIPGCNTQMTEILQILHWRESSCIESLARFSLWGFGEFLAFFTISLGPSST